MAESDNNRNSEVIEGLTCKFGVESLAFHETCLDTIIGTTDIELHVFKKKKTTL